MIKFFFALKIRNFRDSIKTHKAELNKEIKDRHRNEFEKFDDRESVKLLESNGNSKYDYDSSGSEEDIKQEEEYDRRGHKSDKDGSRGSCCNDRFNDRYNSDEQIDIERDSLRSKSTPKIYSNTDSGEDYEVSNSRDPTFGDNSRDPTFGGNSRDPAFESESGRNYYNDGSDSLASSQSYESGDDEWPSSHVDTDKSNVDNSWSHVGHKLDNSWSQAFESKRHPTLSNYNEGSELTIESSYEPVNQKERPNQSSIDDYEIDAYYKPPPPPVYKAGKMYPPSSSSTPLSLFAGYGRDYGRINVNGEHYPAVNFYPPRSMVYKPGGNSYQGGKFHFGESFSFLKVRIL